MIGSSAVGYRISAERLSDLRPTSASNGRTVRDRENLYITHQLMATVTIRVMKFSIVIMTIHLFNSNVILSIMLVQICL